MFNNLNNDALMAAAAQMLQSSGPSRTPTSLGQIIGGGMSTYMGAAQAAKQRELEEQQAKQMAELRAMQMQEMEGALSDRAMKRTAAQKMMDYQTEFAKRGAATQPGTIPNAPPSAMPAEQVAVPVPAKAKSPYQSAMEYAEFLQSKGEIDQAMQIAEDAQKLRPKVKSFEKVRVDGKVLFAPLFEDGTAGQPLPMEAAEKLMQIDRGGSTDLADSYTGQVVSSLKNSVSPNAQLSASVSMRGQNMTDARARDFNALSSQANGIKLSEKEETAKMTKASQVASFDTMLGTLGRLSQHPGLPNSVGLRGALPTMPGSESANFQAELDSFQSQAFIPMVAQLKGMGALSDAEGKKLTAAVGALNPKMGEKAFRESIGRITRDMEGARARVSGGAQDRPAAPAPAAKKSVLPGQVLKGYRFKGGDPSKQANWEKI